MKTLYPQLRITDPSFKYTSSAQTDIRETFSRIRKQNVIDRFAPKNQESKEPLVTPTLNPGAFVLSADWFDMG